MTNTTVRLRVAVRETIERDYTVWLDVPAGSPLIPDPLDNAHPDHAALALDAANAPIENRRTKREAIVDREIIDVGPTIEGGTHIPSALTGEGVLGEPNAQREVPPKLLDSLRRYYDELAWFIVTYPEGSLTDDIDLGAFDNDELDYYENALRYVGAAVDSAVTAGLLPDVSQHLQDAQALRKRYLDDRRGSVGQMA